MWEEDQAGEPFSTYLPCLPVLLAPLAQVNLVGAKLASGVGELPLLCFQYVVPSDILSQEAQDGQSLCYVFSGFELTLAFQRCDGARPTCDQCVRANIVDCEYTDNGPTASQILEESISGLEARIHALQGNPAPIVLRHPHDAYRAHRREASIPQPQPEPKTSSQKM